MFLPNYLPQTCYLISLHKIPPRETPPTNGNPVYSQYIPSLPSPKGPKISNPQPQGPRVPGTGQGGYDMDLVFRQEIGQRLLPRLQQHLKRWAINVGGRNKTWRGCEGWEYLCTSLYIYIYVCIIFQRSWLSSPRRDLTREPSSIPLVEIRDLELGHGATWGNTHNKQRIPWTHNRHTLGHVHPKRSRNWACWASVGGFHSFYDSINGITDFGDFWTRAIEHYLTCMKSS